MNARRTRAASTKRRKRVTIACCLILVAIIVGLAVGLPRNKQSPESMPIENEKQPVDAPVPEISNAPFQVPTSAPTILVTTAPTDGRPLESSRTADIIAFLSEQGFTDASVAWTSGSPQNRAVVFMATQDELQLQVPPSSTHPDAIPFVQRYAVLVFYYSLGVTDVLTSAPTCEWYRDFQSVGNSTVPIGVICNEKDYVHLIQARKLLFCQI